jgi:hypothetical protein
MLKAKRKMIFETEKRDFSNDRKVLSLPESFFQFPPNGRTCGNSNSSEEGKRSTS